MIKKEFELPKRDATKAKVTFVKREGIWFWDLPNHVREAPDGMVASLPLPDVNLDQAKTVKDCLDLIGERRGKDWVGQVIVDLLN